MQGTQVGARYPLGKETSLTPEASIPAEHTKTQETSSSSIQQQSTPKRLSKCRGGRRGRA
jgi:hypothetical protein